MSTKQTRRALIPHRHTLFTETVVADSVLFGIVEMQNFWKIFVVY